MTWNYDCLVLVFGRLSVQDVVRCKQVCRDWLMAASDNIVWMKLFTKDFNLDPDFAMSKKEADNSWQTEYKILVDTVPRYEAQTLRFEYNRIYGFAFSHDGQELVVYFEKVNLHKPTRKFPFYVYFTFIYLRPLKFGKCMRKNLSNTRHMTWQIMASVIQAILSSVPMTQNSLFKAV